MSDDLFMVIELRSGDSGTNSKPLLVSRRAEGVLDEASLSPALRKGLVVYSGPAGWVACDRGTEEVKSLARDTWAEIGGWRIKLVDERAAAKSRSATSSASGATASGSSSVIGLRSDVGHVVREPEQAPYLLLHDAGRADQAPRQEVLPTREGGERILGRSRAEGRITLDDRRVSRDHLRFYCEAGLIHVENLSQYPPTIEVNGEHGRITGRMRLPHRARIRLGGSLVEFVDPVEMSESSAMSPPRAVALPLPPDQNLTHATDPSVQEGFDWVEKTLILLALLLVVWLVYFLLQ